MSCDGNFKPNLKLIIITGQSASGKSTFASFLKNNGFIVCEFSEFFNYVLGSYSTSPSNRLEAVIQYIESAGRNTYINQLITWMENMNSINNQLPLVLVGARHPNDIKLLYEQTCIIEIIGILSTKDSRMQRILSRKRASDLYLNPELLVIPNSDIEECLNEYATIHIYNEGSVEDFESIAYSFALRFLS